MANRTLDIGAVTDTGYVRAQSLSGGMAIPVGKLSLFIDGSGGITSGSPGWAVSIGLGTSTAGLASVSVAALSPLQRLRNTFGAGRSFSATKPRDARAKRLAKATGR